MGESAVRPSTAKVTDAGSLPFVSVVIPVRDDAAGLRRCLAQLERQDYPAHRYEIVVADNGSRVPPTDVVAAGRVRLVHETTRGSYAARNAALRAARGDVVAFTDADCLPASDWLRAGVRALVGDERLGLVVGRVAVVPADPARPRAVELYQMVHGFPQDRYAAEQHFGATANVLTRRAVLDAVGPFDQQLLSGGDKEWGRRVHAAGWHVRYFEDVEVLHPARPTWREYRRKLERVFHGEFDVRDLEGRPYGDVGALGWRSVVPPVRSIARHWSDPRLGDVRSRALYAAGACLARWSGAVAGHRARRSRRCR